LGESRRRLRRRIASVQAEERSPRKTSLGRTAGRPHLRSTLGTFAASDPSQRITQLGPPGGAGCVGVPHPAGVGAPTSASYWPPRGSHLGGQGGRGQQRWVTRAGVVPHEGGHGRPIGRFAVRQATLPCGPPSDPESNFRALDGALLWIRPVALDASQRKDQRR
jgi:hypothetical protein